MVYYILGVTYGNRTIRLNTENRERAMRTFKRLTKLKDKIRHVSVTGAKDDLWLKRGFGEDIAEYTGDMHKPPVDADMTFYAGPYYR